MKKKAGEGTMGRTLTWRAREKDVFDRESGKNFKGKVLILDDCYRSIQEIGRAHV